MAIDRIDLSRAALQAPAPSDLERTASAPDGGFAEALRGLVDGVRAQEAQAAARAADMAGGSPGELHEIAIASAKAEVAFRLMMTVRNRLLEAYREVMRMGA